MRRPEHDVIFEPLALRNLQVKNRTFCNKCLAHVIENPLGCYEEARFVGRGGREEMIRQAMAIFENEV